MSKLAAFSTVLLHRIALVCSASWMQRRASSMIVRFLQ